MNLITLITELQKLQQMYPSEITDKMYVKVSCTHEDPIDEDGESIKGIETTESIVKLWI
jgi:hypothetical protein